MKNTPFSFDFTINLPFLVVVISSIIAGTAWTSGMDTRMSAVEIATSGLPAVRENIARLAERSDSSREALMRIERAVEEQDERGRR